MSLAEHVSRPFPVFAKLAVMLRNIPAVQFVLAKCAALLRTEAQAQGARSTLLTSGQGAADPLTVAKKTLLGQ